jgi:Carboxypeptidase regulatory-like domain
MSEHIHPGPHPDAEQLNAFIEGVLPEHERLESLAHLAECSRCRQLVFLAQEPAPMPVAAESAPAWKSWFRLAPVFSAALAGVICVAVFLHLHHAAKTPAPIEVSTVETPRPLVAPAPIQQPSAPLKPASPKPATRQAPVVQSQPAAAAPEARAQAPSSTIAMGSAIGGALPSDALRYQIKPSSSQGFGQGASQSYESAANDQAETKKSLNINGRPIAPDADANASGAALAAAPAAAPAPSRPANMNAAQLPQLPINGRNVSPIAAMTADDSFRSRDPLRLRIEHNHGPAGNLSEVTGSVVDPSGAIVPRAMVTLRRSAEAVSNKATTDASGRFTLAAVPAGQYEVRIAAPGFETVSQQIELQPRDLALLAPVLPIGAASQTVEVSSATAEMATESQAINGYISGGVMKAKRDRTLADKLSTVTSVSIGDRTLTLDPTGQLFLSRDGGKHWQAVKPVWQGRASRLALLPEPLPASATQSQRTIAGTAAPAPPVSPKSFQLTTDAHVVWVSEDGVHWRLR